jgi:hypothetical protein
MSRIDRLKEYAKPLSPQNWQGCSRDQSYIDRWSRRAETLSDGAEHRASDGKMKLQNTGKRVSLRDTSMQPKVSRKADAAMKAGRDDVNHYGSSYLKSIRREA